jgi:RNA polymerase sigma factor (sigma-70 family)
LSGVLLKQKEYLPDNYLSDRWLQFCAGDKTALGDLFDHQFTPLYHYGTRFASDKGLIKDCIQDLFLEIWEKREKLDHIVSIRAYLFQSLRNNLITMNRKQMRFSDLAAGADFLTSDFSPESQCITDETSELNNNLLVNGIEMLPKRQREALYLKYYEELSHEEIGEIMGLQKQAVANYIHYGIQKLREYVKGKNILLTLFLHFLS